MESSKGGSNTCVSIALQMLGFVKIKNSQRIVRP